jgi:hypothetical protein
MKLKKLKMLIWLACAVLSPILLIRGMWALNQPWGVPTQKIGGLIFFLILWIVSLYFLFDNKFTKYQKLTAREEEKRKWMFHIIGNSAFVLGGIFIISVRPEKLVIGASSAAFFGLGLLVSIIKYKKA